jgi:hypothetical protein
MAKLVLPRVQAMVLCDAAEESDQEKTVFQLTGVRSWMEVLSFPAFCPKLCIYLQISGHEGHANCHIEINRVETEDVIFKTVSKTINLQGPMSVVPMVFRLRNCVFPAPGVYYVQVFHERKLIGERPLILQQES